MARSSMYPFDVIKALERAGFIVGRPSRDVGAGANSEWYITAESGETGYPFRFEDFEVLGNLIKSKKRMQKSDRVKLLATAWKDVDGSERRKRGNIKKLAKQIIAKELLDEYFPDWKRLRSKKPIGYVRQDNIKSPIYGIKDEDWSKTVERNPMLQNIKPNTNTVFVLQDTVGGIAAVRYDRKDVVLNK